MACFLQRVMSLSRRCFILFILLALFHAVTKCDARDCFCNQLVCDNDTSNCSYGVTTDPCGCCQVCARGLGESCGGEGEDAGVCGVGLTCEIQARPGDVISGREKGSCKGMKKGCEDVACDSVVTHRCPSDSVLVYNATAYSSDCCQRTFECQCDSSLCKKPRCAPGHTPFLLRKSYNKPGFCCDLYQCRVLGCQSSTGDVYKNNETWKEGDCTNCHCVDGKKRCQSEMCVKTCLNPKPVPGRCCPICDAPRKYPNHQKDSCPDLSDCNITCSTGLRQTPDGCSSCRCKPDDCYTDCPYGYKFDVYGVETCRCHTLPPQCPSLNHCSRQCAHGFKQSKVGCPKCRCYKCPDISDCTKSCSYGYLTNKHGCHVCKCLDRFPSDNCTVEGEVYLPGQIWSLGNCTDCVCKQDGIAVCLPVTCPVLPCQLMVKKEGLCCPVCLNFSISHLYNNGEEHRPSTVKDENTELQQIEERYIISLCIVGAFVVMLLILVFVLLYLKLKQKHSATWSIAGHDSYCKCPLFMGHSPQIRHKYDLNGEMPNKLQYDTVVVQKYQQPCVEVSVKSDSPLEEKKFIFPDNNGNSGEIDQNCVNMKTDYSYRDWSESL